MFLFRYIPELTERYGTKSIFWAQIFLYHSIIYFKEIPPVRGNLILVLFFFLFCNDIINNVGVIKYEDRLRVLRLICKRRDVTCMYVHVI